MSRTHRANRQSPEDGDFQPDDDFEDKGFSQEVRHERRKALAIDILARWHWILLGLILGGLGATYYLSKAPKSYRATSTVLVKQQASSVMKRNQSDDIDLRSTEGFNTLIERIKRPEFLLRVASIPEIRQLPGLIPEPTQWLPGWADSWLKPQAPGIGSHMATVPPAPELAGHLAGWLSVALRRGTRLLDLSITHPSPIVAKVVADALALEYQAELTGKRSQGNMSSADIIVREWKSAGITLQTSQNALANYQGVLATLTELEERKTKALELSWRYLPKHPRMIAANAALTSTQVRFFEEFESARNAPADRLHWQASVSEWDSDASEGARLQTARRLLLARGNVLGSEIETRTSIFNSLLTHIQESEINQQAVESEMEISSMAQLPSVPSAPDSRRLMGMGLFAGLSLGLLLAGSLVFFDTKLHSVEQIERETGLPVLAVIEEIPTKSIATVAKLNRFGLARIPPECLGWDSRLLFRPGMSDTKFAQAFRGLRTTVSLLGDETQQRIALFSSALPEEGKTFVSSNFALAAAVQGKRTLLIDLDLHRPSIQNIFGVGKDSLGLGAADCLAGQTTLDNAVFTGTGLETLHLLFAGNPVTNPGELLTAVGLEKLFQNAAAGYDLVVVDSAPLLAVADTRLIASLVDYFFLVARAEVVPKLAVKCTLALLAADHNSPDGVIFNGFRQRHGLLARRYSYRNYAVGNYHYAYGGGNA